MRLKTLFIMLITLVISGCTSLLDKHVIWEYEKPEQFPVLRAVGYAPISAQQSDNQQIQQIMAMRASKLDAYRELAEQVYGYQIKGQSNVQNLIASDDKMKARVEGVIRGARIVKSYPVGDTYATELELDMRLVYDLYMINSKPRKIKKVEYY